MKSGPKKQTIKSVPENCSWNQHRNKFESREFWKRNRRIEKEEIKKEMEGCTGEDCTYPIDKLINELK